MQVFLLFSNCKQINHLLDFQTIILIKRERKKNKKLIESLMAKENLCSLHRNKKKQ